MEGDIEADVLCETETDSLMDTEGLVDILVEAETLELKDAETLPGILFESESELLLLLLLLF